MRRRRQGWGLLLGVLLTGCAASNSGLREENFDAATEVEAGPEQASNCLDFLCDESVCGFFHCGTPLEEGTAGEGSDATRGLVVKTRGASPSAVYLYPPGYNGSPTRYWGPSLPIQPPEGSVFVIPWGNSHRRPLLPSQRQLIEEADKRLNQPHEKHHLFPQEFKSWFEINGIDIHQWTMFIETLLHKSIHRGSQGGPWNDAWRQFIQKKRGQRVKKEEIWKYAWELCVRFGLMAPLQPYYGKTQLPPPIGF